MTTERDHRIDFFRGLALIFIFWDHVPHNPLGQITLRNVGFSDAAEIFVFLAGYAAVLAYGKILARDGYLIACVKILRRAWVLYVVHIFLLAMLMGIVFFANSHVETRDLVEEMGLHHFITNPQQALTDELLLRFKPNLMDPLPLYIVLLAGLPLVLPLLVRKAWAVVAVSLEPGRDQGRRMVFQPGHLATAVCARWCGGDSRAKATTARDACAVAPAVICLCSHLRSVCRGDYRFLALAAYPRRGDANPVEQLAVPDQ
jgi:hypothetical protein